MKKDKYVSNNFVQYANHLYSQGNNVNKIKSNIHNMKVDIDEKLFEDFYIEYPEFCVDDCNRLMGLLNDDYINYLKWIMHE